MLPLRPSKRDNAAAAALFNGNYFEDGSVRVEIIPERKLIVKDTVIAEYHDDVRKLIVRAGNDTSTTTMNKIQAVVSRFGDYTLDRVGPMWRINQVGWDGTDLTLPDDLESKQWYSLAVGIKGTKVVNDLKAGVLLHGPTDALKPFARIAKVFYITGEDDYAGSYEAFQTTLYTDSGVYERFIKAHWDTIYTRLGETHELPAQKPSLSPSFVLHGVIYFDDATDIPPRPDLPFKDQICLD